MNNDTTPAEAPELDDLRAETQRPYPNTPDEAFQSPEDGPDAPLLPALPAHQHAHGGIPTQPNGLPAEGIEIDLTGLTDAGAMMFAEQLGLPAGVRPMRAFMSDIEGNAVLELVQKGIEASTEAQLEAARAQEREATAKARLHDRASERHDAAIEHMRDQTAHAEDLLTVNKARNQRLVELGNKFSTFQSSQRVDTARLTGATRLVAAAVALHALVGLASNWL